MWTIGLLGAGLGYVIAQSRRQSIVYQTPYIDVLLYRDNLIYIPVTVPDVHIHDNRVRFDSAALAHGYLARALMTAHIKKLRLDIEITALGETMPRADVEKILGYIASHRRYGTVTLIQKFMTAAWAMHDSPLLAITPRQKTPAPTSAPSVYTHGAWWVRTTVAQSITEGGRDVVYTTNDTLDAARHIVQRSRLHVTGIEMRVNATPVESLETSFRDSICGPAIAGDIHGLAKTLTKLVRKQHVNAFVGPHG